MPKQHTTAGLQLAYLQLLVCSGCSGTQAEQQAPGHARISTNLDVCVCQPASWAHIDHLSHLLQHPFILSMGATAMAAPCVWTLRLHKAQASTHFDDFFPAVLCCLYGVRLQHLVGCLAKVLDSRDSTSPEVAAAGMVINTMGYIDGLGYELLAAAVATFRVGGCQHSGVSW